MRAMSRLFVNRLTVIDFSYLDAERGLVGESWQVDLELAGALDEQGMVLDFGEIKKKVKRLVDEHFDHKLLVPAGHPHLEIQTPGERLEIDFPLGDGSRIRHASPGGAVTLVDAARITPESVTPAIVDSLRPHLPRNIEQVGLHLWPEHIEGAFYQYSHGLKHHCGNCQRIAHGHRSRLQVLLDGERRSDLETEWAAAWADIYIGTREDLAGAGEPVAGEPRVFRYTSEQGEFRLELPSSAVYLIDTDSTVENIAQHIADRLKNRFPAASITVRAFEGVDKGAIGTA